MIEILIIATIIFIIFRTRISTKQNKTYSSVLITINITQRTAFRITRKISKRTGHSTIDGGIVSRRKR